MNDEIKDLIGEIYQIVWNFDDYHDKYEDFQTELYDNIEEIAPIIENYCKTFLFVKNKQSKAAQDAIQNIVKLTRPDNYMEADMNKDKEFSCGIDDNPVWAVNRILEEITDLIDMYKSHNDDGSIAKLESKWLNKWLFFNGDEDGQQIIKMNNIHYSGDQFCFDGVIINLFNENFNCGGMGIQICVVEDQLFEELHYINYIDKTDDYDPDDEDDEFDWSNFAKLDAALSSKPIDTHMEKREMSDQEVKELIDNYLYGEYGCFNNYNVNLNVNNYAL